MNETTPISMIDVARLKTEVRQELQTNILPYWIDHMCDHERGGFYGRITGEEVMDNSAERGAILCARILWSYASAYRVLGDSAYLEMAHHAYRELVDRFYDKEYGGVYWSLNPDGSPASDKKQIYALGFAIYGLSEYHRATNDASAKELALELYHTIETHSFDAVNNGYFEAMMRDWQPLEDMRLSAKDENLAKTMNTHLHILEPYTNLYRIAPSAELAAKLRNLIEIFLERIIDPTTYHLGLFFEDDWCVSSKNLSYGHDIEAGWLIQEAAEVLGDKALLERVESVVPKITAAAMEGLQPDGSLIYEYEARADHHDAERHWWVQSEAIVGLINDYQLTGDQTRLQQAIACWEYVKSHLIDRTAGEWYWSIMPDGSVNRKDDKAGFWKCPYHNSRMCLELIERQIPDVATKP